MAAQSPVLTRRPETASFMILRAREFHTKVDPEDPDEGSNPADDRAIDVLQFQRDDTVVEELISAIAALKADELADLVARVWLGRGDYGLSHERPRAGSIRPMRSTSSSERRW